MRRRQDRPSVRIMESGNSRLLLSFPQHIYVIENYSKYA